MIHEFIADNKAIPNSNAADFASMLLMAAFPAPKYKLINPFLRHNSHKIQPASAIYLQVQLRCIAVSCSAQKLTESVSDGYVSD